MANVAKTGHERKEAQLMTILETLVAARPLVGVAAVARMYDIAIASTFIIENGVA